MSTPPDPDVVRALRRAQDRASRLHFECLQLRRDAAVLGDRVELVEGSIAYRLGAGIVSMAKSPWRVFTLPSLLFDLYRSLRQRRDQASAAAGEPPLLPADFSWSFETDSHSKVPLPPRSLGGLRVVAVLDEFSYATFAPECDIRQLSPQGFEPVLDEFQPHFLLVESAWRGGQDAWRQKVHPVSVELCYLLDCCRRRGIPTVFWNKEDPSHFGNFLAAARLFDHVFTTDITCVPRYREALGHDRVHCLPFGCQPRLHNPVENEPRRAAASFAGSWYERYPERCREFSAIVEAVTRVMPVDIYDRNAGRSDPNFAFPERFEPLIKGALPFSQIDKAYKGYRFGITINTVTSSPSMLARRIYELMACNTLVISNPAQALANGFGELAIVHGDQGFDEALVKLASDEDARHRRQLSGLRHVLGSHTVAHRLAFVANRVLGRDFAPAQPKIAMLAAAATDDEIDRLLKVFAGQSWPHKRLYLVTVLRAHTCVQRDDIVLVDPQASSSLAVSKLIGEDGWVAPISARDHYGRDYLTDLAHAALCSDAGIIGKSKRFLWSQGWGVAPVEGLRYRHTEVALRCSLLRTTSLRKSVGELLSCVQSNPDYMVPGLAIDEFNYCKDGAVADPVSWREVDE